uniref:Uncharacterized protein n=1 Tax=Magallana gigas TaxID=29159 RepID=K1R1L9_MAGGI
MVTWSHHPSSFTFILLRYGALGVRWDKRGELETNLNSRFRHHSRKFLTKHRFITEMFRMFDLNGDGCVERDEFEYVLEFSDIWK